MQTHRNQAEWKTIQQVAACCVEICRVVEGIEYVGDRGGEEGKGQRATIKKGIHRKQANEVDKT